MKIVTGKPGLIKEINRNIVIKLIVKHNSISRADIAKMTKLSLPSVMRIVDSLIEEGLVEDVGKGNSSGGRKPSLIALNKNAMYIIGVEIAIKSTIVIGDIAGEIIDSIEFDNSDITSPYEVLDRIKESIDVVIKRNYKISSSIAGIGIGTPGANFKYQNPMSMAIQKGWEEIDVLSYFKKRYDYPVFVENVARTRTMSELWFGEGRNISKFIYVFVDRGVGCGIVNNGLVHKGANNVAGEFGHTVIQIDGRKCYCGNSGCLEMYVSAGAILNGVKYLDKKFKDFDFEKVVMNSDDPDIRRVIKDSARILGIAVANLINTFNPDGIILGGVVPTRLRNFEKFLENSLKEGIFNSKALDTKIIVSKLDNDKVSLGSVALVINNLFKSVEL